MAAKRPMLVILGPTASGKSSLALAVAQESGARILSVDSMQVYRQMDIGTAKPTPAQRAQVPHHLIDVVDPDACFTAARFVESAEQVIAQAATEGAPLVATGGTPLYYKSLFEGLFEGPPANQPVRDRLRAMPNDQLARRLAEVDPPSAARIHVNDSKRLVRALEVYELTGTPISTLQKEWDRNSLRHRAVWVGLEWDREALNRRINARVREMMAGGWLRETRALIDRYGALSATAGEATGYRELIEHLHGKIALDDAVERIKIETRQLARRQMKWFRRWAQVHWIVGDQPLGDLVEQTMRMWTRGTDGI